MYILPVATAEVMSKRMLKCWQERRLEKKEGQSSEGVFFWGGGVNWFLSYYEYKMEITFGGKQSSKLVIKARIQFLLH